MPLFSSCPRCAGNVTLPAEAGRGDWVRCPLCGAKYPLTDVLDRLPPELIVLPPKSAAETSITGPGAAGFVSSELLADEPTLASDNVDDLLAEPFDEPSPAPAAKKTEPDLDETIAIDLHESSDDFAETVSLKLPDSETHTGGTHTGEHHLADDDAEALEFPEELSLAGPEEDESFPQPSESDMNFVEELEQEPERTEFHDDQEPFDPDSFLGETPFAAPHTKGETHFEEESDELHMPLDESAETPSANLDDEVTLDAEGEMFAEEEEFPEPPPPAGKRPTNAKEHSAAGIPKAVPPRRKKGGLVGKLIGGLLAGIIVVLGSSYSLLWISGKDADFCQLHSFLPAVLCPAEKTVAVVAAPIQPPPETPEAPEVPTIAANDPGVVRPIDSGSPEPPAEEVTALPTEPAAPKTVAPPAQEPSTPIDEKPLPPADIAVAPTPEPPAEPSPAEEAKTIPGNTLTIVTPATPDPPADALPLPDAQPPAVEEKTPEPGLPDAQPTEPAMPADTVPPAEPGIPGIDALLGDDSATKAPAEPAGPLAPAPYHAEVVAKELGEVVRLQSQFEKIASLPKAEASKVRTEYFLSLFRLADAAAFSTPDAGLEADEQKPLVVAAMEKAAADDAKRVTLGKAGSAWLSASKEKRANRFGIFITGKVSGIEHVDGLYVAHIQLAGAEKTMDLLSDKPFLFENGDTVASLARLYENPAEQISGYKGDAELGIWDHLSIKLP